MSSEPKAPKPEHQAAARPAPAADHDEAWDRVLDCGAPGPAQDQPALFYQAARRPPANAGEPPAER